MEGELSSYCNEYYGLMCRLEKQEARFKRLLEKALPYTGQTNTGELDDIISCNRKIQKVRAEADDSIAAMQKTSLVIFQILNYFEIEPYTALTCEIAGEVELEVWADEDNEIHCRKTKDLDPIVDPPDIITIRLGGKHKPELDEDDDD